VNSGSLTADTLFAIQALAGEIEIVNTGLITGFVGLITPNNTFQNQAGGVFEARQLSNFGYGVFNNESGATVHTAADPNVAETTTFVGLEQFKNEGLISLVDGREGDVFELTNCGCTVVTFTGSGNSTLAVDAFLGPSGSTGDMFIVDGNVSGKTALAINNTNPAPGVFNPQGIPVVFVNGNVNGNAFFMPQPFDSGLFDWDLYFVPTGSGFFELRSFPGGGAHVLPQLLTAAQDVFHTTNETWFDRTADLRVLLNGGAAYGAGAGKPQGTGFTLGHLARARGQRQDARLWADLQIQSQPRARRGQFRGRHRFRQEGRMGGRRRADLRGAGRCGVRRSRLRQAHPPIRHRGRRGRPLRHLSQRRAVRR
jgi:hypothetical protein